MAQLTSDDLLGVDRELARRSLGDFVRMAWPVLEPGQAYLHNWHIDAVCDHLEAVAKQDLSRLLINVPGGTLIVSDGAAGAGRSEKMMP